MKKKKVIIIFVIILIFIVGIVFFFLNTSELYKKYQKKDNYKCDNDICKTNNQVLNEKYIYSNEIDTKEKIYKFEVTDKEESFEYNAQYKENENIIAINYVFDEIEWKGTYYIDSNYISLKLNCEQCDINEEEIQADRNRVYIESSNITNDILKIIKGD